MVTFEYKKNNIIVTIEDSVLDEIKEIAKAFYPNEIGGFLVGRYISNSHAHVSCVLHPSNKNCTPYSYERSTDGMEAEWNRLFENNGFIYLGEWHSHPNGSCSYSITDMDAMRGIALSSEVHICKPLMLICSFNKMNEYSVCLYLYNNENLLKLVMKNGTC